MGQRDDVAAPVDEARRKLLKGAATAAGALAAGTIPYRSPAVKSFFGTRNAWAQVTGPLQLVFEGRIGTLDPGTADPAAGQDRWEFEVLVPHTTLTFTAVPDANLVVEIYLYPPGPVTFGDANLFHAPNPLGFPIPPAAQGATVSATLSVSAAGVYTFAIEDDRAPGSEVAGDYQVTIDADKPIGHLSQVEDEGPESDRQAGTPGGDPRPAPAATGDPEEPADR